MLHHTLSLIHGTLLRPANVLAVCMVLGMVARSSMRAGIALVASWLGSNTIMWISFPLMGWLSYWGGSILWLVILVAALGFMLAKVRRWGPWTVAVAIVLSGAALNACNQLLRMRGFVISAEDTFTIWRAFRLFLSFALSWAYIGGWLWIGTRLFNAGMAGDTPRLWRKGDQAALRSAVGKLRSAGVPAHQDSEVGDAEK